MIIKELSIEERAKRYDKLFVKASRIYNKENDVLILHTIEDLFPELKESEDEKIVNAIRKALESKIEDLGNGVTRTACLAWLENIPYTIDHEKREGFHLGYKAGLEKQGEQKPTLRERYKNIAESEWFKKTHDGMSVSDDEKVDNVNKVEPKFKVGNFIKHNRLNVIHEIISFNGDHYFVRNAKTGNIIKLCNAERNFHLWTIQDAKDGDVLCINYGGPKPFIFSKNNCHHAYCALNSFGEFILEPAEWLIKTNVSPATKEQRNLLFQKMKEAGYEWLEETKELKKIEQKPTQVIKPFEAEHGKYYYCIKDYFCGGRKQASKGDVVQALRGLPIMGLKDASEYFLPVNFIKCNSAWSEDDEQMCQETIDWFEKKCFPYALENENPARESIKWLKSLKNRVQPKQECSKEDEYWQAFVAELLYGIEDTNDKEYEKKCRKAADWFKSLKQRYAWKPSIAQLNALSIVSKGNAPDDIEAIMSLYNDLKKLRG